MSKRKIRYQVWDRKISANTALMISALSCSLFLCFCWLAAWLSGKNVGS